MNPSDEPRARVREVNGKLVLDDPDALAVARAVAKHNCRATLDVQIDRVRHFKKRMAELNRTAEEVVIVLINVDATFGADLANALMPGHDWQQYRDRGEVPFARGLAGREGLQRCLDVIDNDASKKLCDLVGLAVVVVDRGTVEVFAA